MPGLGCGTVLFWALLFVGIVALVEVLNAMISANPRGPNERHIRLANLIRHFDIGQLPVRSPKQ